MDRGAIATEARYYSNELGVTYVTPTMMIRAINEAQKQVNLDTQIYRADITISIKSGAREYSWPTAALDIYRVRLGTGSERVGLSPVSRSSLTRDDGDWEGGTAGTPTQYYSEGMKIGFHPRPIVRTTWATGSAYTAGDLVVPATDNGFVYICATAGTSGATHPTWPTTIDGTVGEGATRTPLWRQAGHTYAYVECLKDPDDLSAATSTPTWLPRAFCYTIAKRAALNIARGYDAENAAQNPRFQMLYQEYLQEAKRLKGMASGRSREYHPRIVPHGYGGMLNR